MSSFHDLVLALSLPGFFTLFCGMCGLILGGLTTVVGDRLGQIAVAEDQGADIPENMGICFPASRCEGCARPLTTAERLPGIGWAVSKGKCHQCGYRVPLLYPFAEIGTGILFATIAYFFGPSITTMAVLCAAWFFVALSVADIRHFVLPDSLTISLLWIGLMCAALQWTRISPSDAILGASAGYIFLWVMREAHYMLRGIIGIGGGDLKLLAAIGAWVGIKSLFMTTALAAITGLVLIMIFSILPKRDGGYSPFGPALSIAGMMTILFPEWIDVVLSSLLRLLS